ncbi:MAG: hydroxyacid dehydrogenase [Candidatus Zixiibacteriota bacterium]|nr:MAG: hydroxyacid dehydrogenase [candidate division Zixibacteria bacterium]
MALHVHIAGTHDESFLCALQPLLDSGITLTVGEDAPDPAEYEILICGVPSKELIEASPALRHLIVPWAGLPVKTRDLMLNYRHITTHNLHHNAVPVAELAVAMMLALAKDLRNIDASLRKNDWTPRYETGAIDMVAEKTAVVVGYGAAGKEIAKRCRAMGMNVRAVRRSGHEPNDGAVEIYRAEDLEALLPDAQVIFLSLPLTEHTKRMMGERQLSLLPAGAILINVSRGRIIDEKALYDILGTGKIKAGLDVWYNYPDLQGGKSDVPPSDYAFHELPNVIMTPHLAGNSDMTEVLRARELARLLNTAAGGEQLPNCVDLQRGY